MPQAVIFSDYLILVPKTVFLHLKTYFRILQIYKGNGF